MKAVNKHSKIITAATKVFAKKGFFNARISDIAKEAKVADGTIYLYFNNKVDILLSVFEEQVSGMIVSIQQQLSKENDPRIMLEIFTTRHFMVMKKNKNLAKVIQLELRQTDKLIREYRNTKFSQYVDIVKDIIILGQEQGLFRSDIQPEIAKRAFFGTLDELSRVWNISLETNYTVEEISNQVMVLFLSGLLIEK